MPTVKDLIDLLPPGSDGYELMLVDAEARNTRIVRPFKFTLMLPVDGQKPLVMIHLMGCELL